MNIKELAKELKKKRVPDYFYNLDEKGRHDERMNICFDKETGKWEVYYEERGVRTTDLFFDTEDEACRWILSELLDMD